jgi:Na+-transporting methylmalonyl-CoA/oxaloacetate decarboxylase gamma subunit
MEILDQTVWITAVGMGLTFAAIGLLVLAMIALTRWTREAQETAPVRKEPTDVVYPRGAIPADESLEELEQAAAVAVAVALALTARRAYPTQA